MMVGSPSARRKVCGIAGREMCAPYCNDSPNLFWCETCELARCRWHASSWCDDHEQNCCHFNELASCSPCEPFCMSLETHELGGVRPTFSFTAIGSSRSLSKASNLDPYWWVLVEVCVAVLEL
ncbi:hypothetical protein VNO78_34184 [Psophocarpus tetragonolobus]|uniref:Uncharacterized protein n=1 Tax=Psophocarpus tetragonolobus TaxID=3891 RepID=A0AAN9RS25_PSOTE